MRHLFTVVAIGLVSSLLGVPAISQERDEGEDLFGRDMKDWARSGTSKPSPWRFTTEGVLVCDAVSESMMHNNTFGDGLLTLEWRFVPIKDKTGQTASLIVRSEGDFSCRVSLGHDCGTLSSTIISNSDKLKTLTSEAPKELAKKVGEWNKLKVRMKGKEIAVTVNGKQAGSTSGCANETGYLSLVAADHAIEFRNVLWKEDK